MIQDRTYYVGDRRVSDLSRSMRARRRLGDAWRTFPATTFPKALNVRYATWYQAVYGANERLKASYLRNSLKVDPVRFINTYCNMGVAATVVHSHAVLSGLE